MVVPVYINTGQILYPAVDKSGNTYEIHPITKAKITGITIPMIEKVKKLCLEAATIVSEIGYVAWDVCVDPQGPCLIEGNDFPGHDVYQLPAHRKDNIDLLPRFKTIINDNYY